MQQKKNQKPSFGFEKGGNIGQKFQNTGYKGKKNKYNPNVAYTYCKKIGHVVSYCYRLIGFSDDFQFTNMKNSQGQVRGNGVMIMEEPDVTPLANMTMSTTDQIFSKEQKAQIAYMINQEKMGEGSSGNQQVSDINVNAVVWYYD